MRKFTYKSKQLKFVSERLNSENLLPMCEESKIIMHKFEMSPSLSLWFAYAWTYDFI